MFTKVGLLFHPLVNHHFPYKNGNELGVYHCLPFLQTDPDIVGYPNVSC